MSEGMGMEMVLGMVAEDMEVVGMDEVHTN
jgi:hypothetical protein